MEETLMARVLFVTSRLPFPPREGHQLRSWHVLKGLAARHEVTLLSFARLDDDADAAEEMREHLAGLETFPIASERSKFALAWSLLRSALTREPFVSTKYASRAMRARIAELARDADVVHFDMLPLMRYADVVPAGVPVVYNAHNVEHVLLATRARLHGHPLVRRFLDSQLPRLLGFERRACERAKLVLACSTTDAEQLRTLAPGTRVEVVPNGVDLDGNRPAASANGRQKAKLVFVGQMGWFPNRDGIDWFLHDIFPRIVAARQDAEFVLVGKADGLEVPAEVASHVTLAGFVPDLRPFVHAAAVYVVPLRAGSGTRLKVLEAMALGKAIVTTTIGSEGIVLRDGKSALYADDASSFAAAVVTLLESPDLRESLGAAARKCAEQHYGWDAIGRDLLALYEPLLSERETSSAPTLVAEIAA
jgi:polysaccharide biosynthesis protein PslH